MKEGVRDVRGGDEEEAWGAYHGLGHKGPEKRDNKSEMHLGCEDASDVVVLEETDEVRY